MDNVMNDTYFNVLKFFVENNVQLNEDQMDNFKERFNTNNDTIFVIPVSHKLYEAVSNQFNYLNETTSVRMEISDSRKRKLNASIWIRDLESAGRDGQIVGHNGSIKVFPAEKGQSPFDIIVPDSKHPIAYTKNNISQKVKKEAELAIRFTTLYKDQLSYIFNHPEDAEGQLKALEEILKGTDQSGNQVFSCKLLNGNIYGKNGKQLL